MEIREKFKAVFFNQVKLESARHNFLKELEIREPVDKTGLGYYCTYCQRFSGDGRLIEGDPRVIFPSNVGDELWLVNPHYDGCRGWD